MTTNKPATAAAPDWLLDPKEWDFRFVNLRHLHVLTVYEYARSCPWVRTLWEPWLEERIVQTSGSFTFQGTVETTIRSVIRDYFGCLTPPWCGAEEQAKELMARLPPQLVRARLNYLVFCTPSYPVPWEELPAIEKTAALSLSPGCLDRFRDVSPPIWSSFNIQIDLEADLLDLRRDAERWLMQKIQQSKQKPYAGPILAPRPVALSYLGAYRFKKSKEQPIPYEKAMAHVRRRLDECADPAVKGFPSLADPGKMESGWWTEWAHEARWTMVAMFRNKPTAYPGAKLPHPRWKPWPPRPAK